MCYVIYKNNFSLSFLIISHYCKHIQVDWLFKNYTPFGILNTRDKIRKYKKLQDNLSKDEEIMVQTLKYN